MTKQITILQDFNNSLEMLKSKIKATLPAHIPVEKFIRVTMTAVQKNQGLLQKDRHSLFGACMDCATDGLIPDGKEAALIPFKDKVQYIPMVGGILKKIRNSGELASISPHVVFENDEFSYWVDEAGEHLKHTPKLDGDERGVMKLAYCIATTKDGGVYIEVMTKTQIEKVRSISRARDSGPWVDWPEEQWRKTVVKRIAKRLPMSTDLEELVQKDNFMYDLNSDTNKEEKPGPTKPTRLGKVMASKVVKAINSEVVTQKQTKTATTQQETSQDDMPI